MNLKYTLLSRGAFGGMTANERRLGRFIRDGEGHPAPAPTPTQEPSADDAFASAFAEHAADTPPAPEAVPAPAPEPAAAPAAETPPTAEAGAPGAGDAAPAAGAETPPAGSQAPAAAPAEKPADLSAEDVLSRLAGMIQKPGEQAPAAAVAPSVEAPAAPEPIYSAAEQTQLAEYEKNWPDVSAAESLKRKAEYDGLLRYVFGEVVKYVAPLQDQMRAVGNTIHLGEVKALVPDYTENLETDVSKWVDTQPAYLQSAYKQVMQTGTSDEIADLIGRYRAATGTAPAAQQVPASPAPPAAPAAAPAAAPKTELSSAAKQAAESLAPVSGDRSAVPQGEDTQDYDTAFSKYAAAGGI